MKAMNIDHVTTMARLGEAVAALVKESGVLAKRRGRKRGPYKRRTKKATKARLAKANGADRSAKRKRPLGEATAQE